MRIIYATAIALLVIGAGIAAIFYFKFSWEGVTALVGFVFRNAIRRAVSKTLWYMFTPAMPLRRRLQMKRFFKRCRRWFSYHLWERLSHGERAVVAICLLIITGYLATYYNDAFSLLTVLIPKTELAMIVSAWMQQVALPYLFRTFAGMGLEKYIPEILKYIPLFLRIPLGRCILFVWWSLTPRVVSSRRALGVWARYEARKRRARAYLNKRRTSP